MHLVYLVSVSVKIFGLEMSHVRFMLGLVVQFVNSAMGQVLMTATNVLRILIVTTRENAFA